MKEREGEGYHFETSEKDTLLNKKQFSDSNNTVLGRLLLNDTCDVPKVSLIQSGEGEVEKIMCFQSARHHINSQTAPKTSNKQKRRVVK
jgi:hypothetical protein